MNEAEIRAKAIRDCSRVVDKFVVELVRQQGATDDEIKRIAATACIQVLGLVGTHVRHLEEPETTSKTRQDRSGSTQED